MSEAAEVTKTVRVALREAAVGDSDYDINSRTTDDGVVTMVIVNGWLPSEGRELIASTLKGIEGAKVKRYGSEFTLTFSG